MDNRQSKMRDPPKMRDPRSDAAFYDLDPRPLLRDDIPFYVGYAREASGPVLELGIGTGRVGLALCYEGYRVLGIDLSISMLARAAKKHRERRSNLKADLSLVLHDFSDFSFGRNFGLIICPYRGLASLTSRTKRLRCFECVAEHLRPGGRFIFSLSEAFGGLDARWVRPEEKDWEAYLDDKTKISRFTRRQSVDLARDILSMELVYRVEESAEENLWELIQPISIAFITWEEIADLAIRCGFEVEEALGYYDGAPLKKGAEMIFVLRKRDL